jgi:hypothetical protein
MHQAALDSQCCNGTRVGGMAAFDCTVVATGEIVAKTLAWHQLVLIC